MSTNKTKKRKKRCPNGAIRQTSNGTFVGRVPMGFTGERYVYKIVTGKSKADVKNQVEQLKLKFNGVEITEESLMTLSSWMDYWLEEIKKPMISYTTYDNYRSFIDKHINPLLGFKKLIRITREDIIRFMIQTRKSLHTNYNRAKKKKYGSEKRRLLSLIQRILQEKSELRFCALFPIV
ncbi:MAG: hypothetical protein J6K85_00135 [Clostridia bacterium]|nr:hypothetical protein [Clostridia bacterium]